MKLGTRFTLALLAVFVVGVAISWVVLWGLLERQAEQTVHSQGIALMETMNAVRHYTSTRVNPLLADDLQTEPEFISESVPAFSAREVFERFREAEAYQDFFYKEATLNPTNARDIADSFETEIVQRFRSEAAGEISGFRTVNDRMLFYSARPLTVSAESCLQCHGEVADAPASLIATFGSNGGFGWELDEIIAAQMIYVPADEVFSTARASFTVVIVAFVATFAVVVLLINLQLQQRVIAPLAQIAGVAQKITREEITLADMEHKPLERVAQRGDELGQTAVVFQQMAQQVIEREERLKQQVRQLQIKVDEALRERQVDDITATDYFQSLQSRAHQLRSKHKRGSDDLSEHD
jgi:hypothetical protein